MNSTSLHFVDCSNHFATTPRIAQFVKLTPENVNMYIGYEILFITQESSITSLIISVSKSCKTIKINYPKLHNCLEILHRNICVIIP
jgi:hypothetical protein